jgi:hypothetical protein
VGYLHTTTPRKPTYLLRNFGGVAQLAEQTAARLSNEYRLCQQWPWHSFIVFGSTPNAPSVIRQDSGERLKPIGYSLPEKAGLLIVTFSSNGPREFDSHS